MSKLFENGIETAIDVFETQRETVNLYTMMLKNIKDKDFTILVLTEEYAEKADALKGGVGFETNSLVPYIMDNLQKIIPIVRTHGAATKAIPFYLRGVHYIDFSADNQFQTAFNELLHRVYKVDLIEKPKLGKRPDLKPIKIDSGELEDTKADHIDEDMIPDFTRITDIDINRFLKKSYTEISTGLHNLLDRTKRSNSDFDFEFESITTKKTIIRIYLNGQQKYSVKIWLGNGLGARQETINLSYGNYISESDNSMNEIIMCEVDKSNKLILKMTMNFTGIKDANDSKSVTAEIWKNIMNWIK